jgi:general secretion pathway protein E
MLESSLLAAMQVTPFISPWKLIPFLLVVFIWAKLIAWADKDLVAAHMPRDEVNLGMLGGLIVGAALFFFLPNFLVGLLAMLVCLGIDIGVYLFMRNAKVGLKDLKGELKAAVGLGPKKVKGVQEVVDQVQFIGSNGKLQASPDAEDPSRPVFDLLQEALNEPLHRHAEIIELIPSEEGDVVRYVVDGVGYRARTLDRANSTAVIAMAKKYAGMDIKERRKPQTGKVNVSAHGKKHDLRVTTAGSSAGEAMRILVDPKTRHSLTLDKMGFTDKQLKTVTDSIAEGTGIVLVTAPATQGLTSMLYALVRGHDAFIQHLQTIERGPDQDLEGITQNPLPTPVPAGEEARVASWVASQQPDVIMISAVEDPQTTKHLIEFAKEHRVYVGMRAASVNDAIAQWRTLVGDAKLAASRLDMVIAGRIIRKLCPACKIAYTPDPATLRKMNMDPNVVTQLFQARSQPMRNEKGQIIPCTFCLELRFNGRVGVFEVLKVDDDVRAALNADSSSQLKAAFRKQKGQYLQEAALEVVEKGETSVQEVLRVLRGPEAKTSSRSSAKAEAAQ